MIWYNEYRIVKVYRTYPSHSNYYFALQRRCKLYEDDEDKKTYSWYTVFYSNDKRKCKGNWEERLKDPEKYKER